MFHVTLLTGLSDLSHVSYDPFALKDIDHAGGMLPRTTAIFFDITEVLHHGLLSLGVWSTAGNSNQPIEEEESESESGSESEPESDAQDLDDPDNDDSDDKPQDLSSIMAPRIRSRSLPVCASLFVS